MKDEPFCLPFHFDHNYDFILNYRIRCVAIYVLIELATPKVWDSAIRAIIDRGILTLSALTVHYPSAIARIRNWSGRGKADFQRKTD